MSWKTSTRTIADLARSLGPEAILVAITLVTMISGWFAERADAETASLVFYVIAYITGGYFGLRAGIESLRGLRIDIDLLMILAAGGAAAVGAPFEGALLLFLFSLSNVLQNFALDRTRHAIRALTALKPDTAIVLEDPADQRGESTRVEDIDVGAYLQIRPGDRIALDAVVVSGSSAVDQSSVTGESLPVEKWENDEVLAGTINQQGQLVVRVTRPSSESTLAKVITLVEQAQSNRAPTQRFLDTFEQYYAIVVILATIAAGLLPPYLFGTAWDVSVYRAITLMVAASPCALIISTPASILSSIGNGARRGILFKGGVHVEQAGGIQAIAFDKTGTLTEGKPRVSGVYPVDGISEDELLAAAAALESKSEHVIGEAVVSAAAERGVAYSSPDDFTSTSGVGVQATVAGKRFCLGSPVLLEQAVFDEGQETRIRTQIEELQQQANTVIVLAEPVDPRDPQAPAANASHAGGTTASGGTFPSGGAGQSHPAAQSGSTGQPHYDSEGARLATATVCATAESPGHLHRVLGLIALRDRIRPEAARIISEIKAAGVAHVVMLTGDNRTTAEAIGREAGVDEVFPELLPDDKLHAIERIEAQYGPTAMVGDGVNDAPALAAARLGIAMGAAGSDVALESADVVLLSDDLEKLPYLIELSRSTRRTLVANMTIALTLIGVMIVGIYTIDLPLPIAVIGHEGGTVLVSLNGMRLLMYKQKKKKR